MKRNAALIALVLAAGAGYFFLKSPSRPQVGTEVQETTAASDFESTFNYILSETAERAELSDVTGGNASGIASRDFTNGVFSHVVLADLPEPIEDTFYEGWLVRGKDGDVNFAFISTGRLQIAKGGYLLEFEANVDYRDYTQVVVTLEEVFDKTPEEHILEGSF